MKPSIHPSKFGGLLVKILKSSRESHSEERPAEQVGDGDAEEAV